MNESDEFFIPFAIYDLADRHGAVEFDSTGHGHPSPESVPIELRRSDDFDHRDHVSEVHLVLMSAHVTSMLFLTFVVAMILQSLMTQSAVTKDSIAGAFCGYVLMGVIFAEIFCLLELNVPNSFQVGLTFPDWTDDPLQRWLTLEYFSLTTLTTLGFGDVIPITPAARGLAVFEAICGQFYLAVLVAGLVNLRASRP